MKMELRIKVEKEEGIQLLQERKEMKRKTYSIFKVPTNGKQHFHVINTFMLS